MSEENVRPPLPEIGCGGSRVMTELVAEFKAMDLENREALLEWLVRFHHAWDAGSWVNARAMSVWLISTGHYHPIRETPAVKPANRIEHADFLIGQAVAWLEDGPGFPEVFPIMVERWRVRVW